MTKNEKLYERAVEAATDLFNDTSVDQATAKENLQAFKSHIDTLLSSLRLRSASCDRG